MHILIQKDYLSAVVSENKDIISIEHYQSNKAISLMLHLTLMLLYGFFVFDPEYLPFMFSVMCFVHCSHDSQNGINNSFYSVLNSFLLFYFLPLKQFYPR